MLNTWKVSRGGSGTEPHNSEMDLCATPWSPAAQAESISHLHREMDESGCDT